TFNKGFGNHGNAPTLRIVYQCQLHFDYRAAYAAFRTHPVPDYKRQRTTVARVEMRNPFSGDGNAHGFSEPVVADDAVPCFASDTVVRDGTTKSTILYGNSDVNSSSGAAWKQSMDDGVLDEGLDEKGRYHDVGGVDSRC